MLAAELDVNNHYHLLDLLPQKDQSFFAEQAKIYQAAHPFPHIVLDNLFDAQVLERVCAEFPATDSPYWKRFKNNYEVKLASQGVDGLGPTTFALLQALNSSPFIYCLQALTGIDGLIPDPHFVGGGLHQIVPGGRLGVHADFNKHKSLKLDRRLNLLLYLNKEWEESYGGHLELWDTEMQACQQKVLPIFNRMVVFTTTDFTFHGHPEPLTCPADNTRKSIALYYYTNGRPASEVTNKHNTLFKDRPGIDEQRVVSHKTSWTSFLNKIFKK